MAVYLDSSAVVKLVVAERESTPLRKWLASRPVRIASALVRVEVVRAVRAQGTPARARADRLLSAIRLLSIDDDLLRAAATVGPTVLRSLDAIHVASAALLGSDLEALVTYDARMIAAASSVGMKVASPS